MNGQALQESVVEISIRNWSAVFFEDRTFCRLLIAVPLKMYSKMNFGWSNVKIGRKIANGQLLFLALGIQIG